MKQYIWKKLGIRILIGWILVSIVPFIIMFWSDIFTGSFQITQINSLVASSFAILLVQITLEKFSKFPGQRSLVMVLPVLLTIVVAVGGILLIFRLPYSVYYLTLSFVLILIFSFISQIYIRTVTNFVMGYVPLGRCIHLPEIDIKGVQWIELDINYQTSNYEPLPFNALVADLANKSLTGQWEQQLAETTLRGVPVYNVLQIRESLTGRLPIKNLYENNLGSLLPSDIYLLVKRLMDTLVIILSAPVIIPICFLVALGIFWESRETKAPVLFIQKRVGQGGKIFSMYKFRSMIPSSEKDGAKMASNHDIRITNFGRFIRKTRLDELPQFFNVLKGEMSLIGPRPEQQIFVEQFNENIPFYRYRHIVKPGISGWAQVTHGYASDEDETKVKLEHDFYYIKNFSLTLDLLIVVKTIQTMLSGFGAR